MNVPFIILPVFILISSQLVQAADSDGDGVPDNIDPNPLVADFNIRWEITCISTRWAVSSVAGKTVTKTITESSVKSETGAKTWDATTEVGGNINTEVKGSVSLNPLRTLDSHATASMGMHAGASSRWGWSTQARHVAENMYNEVLSDTETVTIREPQITFVIRFYNCSTNDIEFEPQPIPVCINNIPVVFANLDRNYIQNRTKVVIPASRADGVDIPFCADLGDDQARKLLSEFRVRVPVIDVAKSTMKFFESGKTTELISMMKETERKTVPVVVMSDGYEVTWRVAKGTLTIKEALEAINKAIQNVVPDFFQFRGGSLVSVSGSPLFNVFEDIQSENTIIEQDKLLSRKLGNGIKIKFNYVERDHLQNVNTTMAKVLKGDAVAMTEMGFMFLNGEGIPKDEEAAARWFRKAAEQGDVRAHVALGEMFIDGRTVAKDEEEAARWFRKAADQGNANGQVALGIMYRDGKGVLMDEEAAVMWFLKAAEQGNANGQNGLGIMYRDGRGVSRDLGEAIAWFRRAAAKGNAPAKESLRSLGFD
ncbi:MAG: tetratricopeptide repeat protein [bacterium]